MLQWNWLNLFWVSRCDLKNFLQIRWKIYYTFFLVTAFKFTFFPSLKRDSYLIVTPLLKLHKSLLNINSFNECASIKRNSCWKICFINGHSIPNAESRSWAKLSCKKNCHIHKTNTNILLTSSKNRFIKSVDVRLSVPFNPKNPMLASNSRTAPTKKIRTKNVS